MTGRPKVLVFNGCYHGTVDETFVRLVDGRPVNRPGLLGQVADLTQFARVVEFNDLPANAPARRVQQPALFDFNPQPSTVVLRKDER